jgi:hypothetical protein
VRSLRWIRVVLADAPPAGDCQLVLAENAGQLSQASIQAGLVGRARPEGVADRCKEPKILAAQQAALRRREELQGEPSGR